jgi:hypothetical protein
MADIATPVQGQPDQPYFWSRPTSEPKPDISGEIKGKAIGSALQAGGSAVREGVQGITAAYEKGIQNSIYAAVDPVRDAYIGQLHSADQALQGRDTPDPLGRDAPHDVKGLPRTLGTLDSARQNGKLSQTDYDARLTALAKEIRGKYPGFRQYVDEEFKRVTGRDSANQYIRSVIGDIDSFIAGKQAKRDSLETHLMTNGLKYHGFDNIYAAYKKNPDLNGPMALKWLNENMAADHDTQEYAANSRAQRDQMQVSKEVEDKAFQQYASSSSKHWWNAAGHGLAMSIDLHNPKWNADAQAIERGEKIPDMGDEEATAVGSWFKSQGEAAMVARTKQIRDALNTKSSGGPTTSAIDEDVRSQITDKQIEQQVETERKMFWDPYGNALTEGNYAAAKRHFEMNKGRAEDDLNVLMTDKQYGSTIQRRETLRKTDPTLYQEVTQAANKVESALVPYLSKQMIDATTPPTLGGRPFSEMQEEALHKNVSPAFHGAMADMIPLLGKTGKDAIAPAAREALINNVFGDPDGAKYLQAFINDEKIRNYRGGTAKGRQFVYDQMYSDANVKMVEKMAKDKPELYEHLRNSVATNVAVMMPHEYLTAAQVPFNPKTRESRPEGLDVYYNNKEGTFSSKAQGPGTSRSAKMQFDQVAANLHRLVVVDQHDPKGTVDPSVLLYQHLKESYPSEEGSMIWKMLGAIRASYQGGVGFKGQ